MERVSKVQQDEESHEKKQITVSADQGGMARKFESRWRLLELMPQTSRRASERQECVRTDIGRDSNGLANGHSRVLEMTPFAEPSEVTMSVRTATRGASGRRSYFCPDLILVFALNGTTIYTLYSFLG